MAGRLASESEAYKRIRDELLAAEIALKAQRERVAKLRRSLPLDSAVEDYLFREGPRDLSRDGPEAEVRLSELFEDRDKPLLLFQYMYGGAQKDPCPMCSMWADGYQGVAPHLAQHFNLGLIAEAEIERLREVARARGWADLRPLSSAGSTFKRDLGFQSDDGAQLPGVSIFVQGDGGVRHFYSASAFMGEGENRGMDLLTPVWNLIDLTPQGRGDWFPSLEYGQER